MLRSQNLIIISLLLTCSGIANLIQPATARSEDQYFCAFFDNIPSTFVRTEIKTIKILTWVNQMGEEWTPVKRCIEVSRRFQRFSEQNILQEISAGTVNNQPVLCAVPDQTTLCNKDNVLVTLPVGEDAIETARKLIDIGSLASGREIYVSGNQKLETYANGQTYYNLELIKQLAPAIETNLTPIYFEP